MSDKVVHIVDDPRDREDIRTAWEKWSRTVPEAFWDVAVWFGDEWRTGSLDIANRYEIFAHIVADLQEENR